MNEFVQNTLIIGMPFMMTSKTGPKQYVAYLYCPYKESSIVNHFLQENSFFINFGCR